MKTLALFLLLWTAFSVYAEAPSVGCHQKLISQLEQLYPKSLDMEKAVEEFAKKWNLPTQVFEVGPAERRVQRLYVGIDANNKEMMADYLKTFNLQDPVSDRVSGTLALEFQKDDGGGYYVTGVLRTSSNPAGKIYRWGKEDLERTTWERDWLRLDRDYKYGNNKQPIFGFSHLIPLDKKQAKNVRYFLEHPEQRGPCKSDNCVAWTSGIELGRTAKDATDEERNYLFSDLGMTRAMAHFEIGRRLQYAASQKHSAIMVFLNGEKGADAFKDLAKYLPPDPKIPYDNIIKDLHVDPKSPMYKAVSQIPDNSKVFIPIAAGASPAAVNGLIAYAKTLDKGLDVHFLVNGISESALRKASEIPGDKFRMHALFLGGNMRKLAAEGKVNYIPGYLSDFNRMVRDPDMKDFHYDAIVVRVSKPDWLGRYSLGPNSDMIKNIIRDRPDIKIIAEVNPNVPYTYGDTLIPGRRIAAKFNSETQLAGPPVLPPSNVDASIGNQLGKLINSGATLQIGIGNIFSGLPDGLAAAGKKGINIHTEMLGDPMKQMIERGIANRATTGFAYGSDGLYKWLNKNKKVTFSSTESINNPGVIANTPNFHAVNTALQVNLYGDVNATMGPGGARISSPGGQVEFMSGASRSQGGKAIIAIRSTAKNGELSTITLDNYPGPVTTPSESVSHVVTEYGTAELKGKTERDRAIALINVAHPKFRKELADQAVQRGLIKQTDFDRIRFDEQALQ